jgi:hypothetical protein
VGQLGRGGGARGGGKWGREEVGALTDLAQGGGGERGVHSPWGGGGWLHSFVEFMVLPLTVPMLTEVTLSYVSPHST